MANELFIKALAAQEAANRHPGGAHWGWVRMMARNSYTIDPREPADDEDDLEKDRLIEEARAAAREWAAQEAERFGTDVEFELWRAYTHHGWLWTGRRPEF